jgi:hypothetical protein
MRSYRAIDLEWTWSGDITLSHTGDLGDTSGNSVGSFVQEVQTRLRSDLKDWQVHPHLGASLSDLIGEPNTRAIAEEGETRIRSALVRDGFCDASLIRVRYVPVDRHHILYNIRIELPGLEDDERLKFSLLFDTNEYDVTFL